MKRNLFLCAVWLGLAIFASAQNPPGPTTTTQLQMPVQTALAPVTSAAIATVGNPGPQKIYYWIVANYPLGATSPAGPFAVRSAPNVLSVSNYVSITPIFPVGATSIDVLKTATDAPPQGACNCAVATAVTSGSVSDQSNSTLSYTLAPVNVNALTLTIQNEVVGSNQSHAIMRQNGQFVTDLSSTHSGSPTGPAGGDLFGTYPNPGVGGIDSVPLCTGFSPLSGYGLEYTTASSPNPCYTAVPLSSFTNPMTTLGDTLYGGTSGTPTRLPGATAPDGVAQAFVSIPSGGVATAPVLAAPGIVGRSVTGTTDTILSTDCSPKRVAYTGAVAVAVSLPTPTTLGVPQCTLKLANNTTNTVTITPATWTISAGSGGTAGATLALLEGQEAIIFVDPTTASNWAADVVEQGISAGTGITLTRAASGLSISSTAGGVTSVSGTAPIVSSGGATPAISCPTCATTPIFSTAVTGTSMVTSGTNTVIVGPVSMVTPAAAGTYRFVMQITQTTPGSGGTCTAGVITATMSYKDADTSVSYSNNIVISTGSLSSASTAGTISMVAAANGVANNFTSIPREFRAASGTVISYEVYQSTNSNCTTPPVFAVRPALYYMGY